MTGIADLFREFSSPDDFDSQYQLELFGWRERAAARERMRLRYAIVRSTPSLREAKNAYERSKSAARREYWRAYKARKRAEQRAA